MTSNFTPRLKLMFALHYSKSLNLRTQFGESPKHTERNDKKREKQHNDNIVRYADVKVLGRSVFCKSRPKTVVPKRVRPKLARQKSMSLIANGMGIEDSLLKEMQKHW